MTAELAFKHEASPDRNDGSFCVNMRPAQWLVALFFPPISLYFDRGTRQLMGLHGRSLLKENKGGHWQMTDIDLYYLP